MAETQCLRRPTLHPDLALIRHHLPFASSESEALVRPFPRADEKALLALLRSIGTASVLPALPRKR